MKNVFYSALLHFCTIIRFAQTTFTADMKDGRNFASFESDAALENIIGMNKVSGKSYC